MPQQHEWEVTLLKKKIMTSPSVTHAVIARYADGVVLAAAPAGFTPDHRGVHDIIAGLKGDTSGLAERFIHLGGGTEVMTPGKVEKDTSMFGSDAKSGGCIVFKTKTSVLIVLYHSNIATVATLVEEVAKYMTREGH